MSLARNSQVVEYPYYSYFLKRRLAQLRQ